MQLSGKTMARVFSVGDLGCSWKIYSSAYSWNRNIEETIKVCLKVDGYTKKARKSRVGESTLLKCKNSYQGSTGKIFSHWCHGNRMN